MLHQAGSVIFSSLSSLPPPPISPPPCLSTVTHPPCKQMLTAVEVVVSPVVPPPLCPLPLISRPWASFHPPTTPQAVAHEAGGRWCVVGSPSSSSCICGGCGGGGPPSRPRPEGMSWGRVGMSSMRHHPGGCHRGPMAMSSTPCSPCCCCCCHPFVWSCWHVEGVGCAHVPMVSPLSFHPPTTPRAVACEAEGRWCVVRS